MRALRLGVLQDGDLLAEREDLELERRAAPDGGDDHIEEGHEDRSHAAQARAPGRKSSMISRPMGFSVATTGGSQVQLCLVKISSGRFRPVGLGAASHWNAEDRHHDEPDSGVNEAERTGDKLGDRHDPPGGESDHSRYEGPGRCRGSAWEFSSRRRFTQPRAKRSGEAARRRGVGLPPSRELTVST